MIYFVTSVRLLEFTNFWIDLNNIWRRHLKIPLMKEFCWTGITHCPCHLGLGRLKAEIFMHSL